MTAVLEVDPTIQAEELQRQSRRRKLQAYYAAVRNEKVPTPEEIVLVSDAIDKTVADFRSDREKYLQRVQWAAEAEKLEGIKSQLAKVEERHENKKAEKQAAIERFDRELAAIWQERNTLHSQQSAIENAADNLWRNYPWSDLLEEERVLIAHNSRLCDEIRKREEFVARVDRGHTRDADSFATANAFRRQLEDLQRQHTHCQGELAYLHSEKLKP